MSKRLSMRKIKEVLRLKWGMQRSNREIATSIKASTSTISDCVRRAQAAGLSWPLPGDIDDVQLEQMLYKESCKASYSTAEIDWAYVHQELKRKGVTRELLWYEYKELNPHGVGYSQFCELYRKWQGQIDCCMRQNYKAGEKMFVDYAGLTVPIICNVNTGEMISAQIFVAVLGASNYTYAEATASQSLPDWIGSHTSCFEYFGGVPEIGVPDNLKTGVSKAHCYEPDINPTYADMAEHYGIAIIPTRISAPRDKAKVEQAVQQVERQILAKLRNRRFFSLKELNDAIKPLLEEMNSRPFQKLPGSRKSQFEAIEKQSLKPLPISRYIFAEWKKAKAGIDYHVALAGNYYSVPHTFIKKEVDIRYTQRTVEIFYKSKRIAIHRRSFKQGAYITLLEHMPKAHQKYAEWTPPKIIIWAKNNGIFTGQLAEKIIASRKHPYQGYRSCMGIIRLGKSYGQYRLEHACKRALSIGAYSYKSVKSILKNNLDQLSIVSYQQNHATEQEHENVRGGEYFQ